jgi:serine protease inhibitor
MTGYSIRVALFVIVPLLLTAPLGANQPHQAPSIGDPVDTRALVEGNNAFALDLYGKVRNRSGNLLLSPYSISSALAMTYAGARDNTASQMAEVLHIPPAEQDVHKAFSALAGGLATRGKAGDFELSVTNALWQQKGKTFLDEFLNLNSAYYGAHLGQVDFIQETESARKTINGWVKKQTGARITELITPGILGPSTRLILTNAVYFKGDWACEFGKENTEPRPFWLGPDTSVTVQMMHRRAEFNYAETPTLEGVELPYADSSFSMIVFLPGAVDGLAELESSLTPLSLERWLSLMRRRMMIVGLPRFKACTDLRLDEVLPTMGMTDAFNPKLADFSGMTGRKDLFIDAVVHKASLEVDEAGTEAAAGTAVAVKKRYPVVRVDRPFLFIIRDNDSGSILFMGRVTDPTQQSDPP